MCFERKSEARGGYPLNVRSIRDEIRIESQFVLSPARPTDLTPSRGSPFLSHGGTP